MKRRTPVLAIATLAVIGASYVRWSPHPSGSADTARPDAAALLQSANVGRTEVTRLIGAFEVQVARQPTAAGYKFLAQLYLDRGRLTGDVATYGQAHTALDRAAELAPADRETDTLLAGVLATTHDFAGAAAGARAVIADNPHDLGAAAVLGDAQLELGDYDGATTTYKRLAADSPDAAAVLVRQARLAFLTAHVDDARTLAKRAKDQASASAFAGVALAFYSTFQGQIEHDTGHYAKAATYYRQALREAPGYYIALAGLARELAAEGRVSAAIDEYRHAIEVVPQPDAVAALGDLYRLRHDDANARTQYDTVGAIATLAALNRQVYNRALVVYDADHDTNIDEAVRMAETELTVRHDIYGYDTYAWALYKAHRYDEAQAAATKALGLATPDARLLYHAGMIDAALGNDLSARDRLRHALAISPNFDPVNAPIARSALTTIERHLAGGTK